MRPIPSLSESTLCRSEWTASQLVSHNWTPKRRNVSVLISHSCISYSCFCIFFNYSKYFLHVDLVAEAKVNKRGAKM